MGIYFVFAKKKKMFSKQPNGGANDCKLVELIFL